MSDKKPVPPSLAEFALEQLAEAGEQAAIDLTVQNVEILRAEIERRDARIFELEASVECLTELQASMQIENDRLKAQQPSAGVVVHAIQQAVESVQAPEGMTASRSEYFKAGARATVRAVNSALKEVARLNPCRAQAVLDGEARHDAAKALHNVMEAVPCSSLYSMAEAVLDAGYSLNPCRAQAVVDGWVMVPVNSTEAIRDAIDLLCDDSAAFDDSEAFWRYLIAAATSANSEQARACVTCNGVGIIGHSTLCPECAAAPSAPYAITMTEDLKQQQKRERRELRKKQEAREEIIREAATKSLSASRSCCERISFSSIPLRRLIGGRDDE